MASTPLEKVERIARNLPISPGNLVMGFVETDRGPVYLAYGLDGADSYHGIWAVGRRRIELARTLSFKPNTTEPQVKQMLLDDGYGAYEMFGSIGLFDEGWWDGGRVGT